MISQVITKIQDELSEVLDENQMKCLSAVLQKHLSHFEKTEKEDTAEKKTCYLSLLRQSASRDVLKNPFVTMNLQFGICWKA